MTVRADSADSADTTTGSGLLTAEPTRPVDKKLEVAVDLARAAADEVAGEPVGEHLGVVAEAKRVATHAFAATVPGYAGWYWAVTVARARKQETVTVDEVVLLPGPRALLAPRWVPWSERVQAGDLSPGELLPPREEDPRLVPAYVQSDDPAVEEVAFELGLGREQVMSREGRLEAADRWYAGPTGPDTSMARQAPARCGTCGFLLSLAGSLRAGFGVCGNDLTDSDGRVVSVEYGCGAHSQTEIGAVASAESAAVVYDDGPAMAPTPLVDAPEQDVTEQDVTEQDVTEQSSGDQGSPEKASARD